MISLRIALVLGLLLVTAASGCSDSGSSGEQQRPPDSQGQEMPTDGEDPPDDSGVPQEPPPEGSDIRLSVEDVTVHEDEGPLTFVVRAEGTGDRDAWVDFRSVDGSATAGDDYVAGAGTLRFRDGDTEQTITIEIVDDDEPEETETFGIQLENPLGAELARGSATGTILDDDTDVCEPPGCGGEQSPNGGRYNIVVVYTDDQRFDTLDMTIDGVDVIPNVKQRLLPIGVKFENAYTPIPLCCPARASTYSGGFLAQDTGVLDNMPPNGGMAAFNDRGNIGVRLQQAGYRTMFVGKWLNDYPNFTPYVPPGWDAFVGRASWANGAGWFNFRYVFGSTRQSSGTGDERGSNGQYHPYFERDRIVEFIEETPDDQPYLVFWSTTPPHLPAVADVPDRELFADFRYRGRGYRETDLSDKPLWVKHPGRPIGDDEEVRVQVQSLHSLDRAIGGLLDTLAARGDLDKTVIIVTSDNGYMWGEHGVWNKKMPYEESIRVPLLVVMPGIEPRSDEHLVSAILDLGPTLYDIAGTSGPTQGRSLLPLLKDPSVDWRDSLFVEHYGVRRSALENWAAIRQGRWKYVEYWYGEKELYDLEGDPFELENRAGDPAVEQVESALRQRLRERLGLAIHPIWRNTSGRVGERYRLEVPSWGGEPPLEWTVDSGQLPPGLRLNPATGEITGTPTLAGTWTFRVRVTGSATAVQAQRPQSFVSAEITITID